jgi:hypothetical protein
MKLAGLRCDNCGAESRQKPGPWHETRVISVSRVGFNALPVSDGQPRHYCGSDCLLAAARSEKAAS